MKKKLIIICSISDVVIAGIVIGVVLLLGSNKSGNTNPNPTINPDVKTFSISFDSDGGSKVDSIKVECGKELSLSTNPTKEGYIFNGTKCTTTTSATEECKSGYSWSDKVKKCVAQTTATSSCPEGYTWSSKKNIC